MLKPTHLHDHGVASLHDFCQLQAIIAPLARGG